MKRRVLITGGSRGIGRAIALRLGRDGFHVVINYREQEKAAEETRAAILDTGGSVSLLMFDVSDRSACMDTIEQELLANGSFYGVVCNAGVHADAPFPGMSEEGWDRVLRTNLDSFFNVLRPIVLPMVRARMGGRIVTISSTAGIVGNRGQVNYSASKAGLIGATRSLALELAKRKITVNSVAPGLISTDMTTDLPLEHIEKLIPMQRVGKPEEVSAVVGFLFSDEASYLTGQVISVNGGMR